MSYTMEDFKRDLKKEAIAEMTPEEILEEISLQHFVEGMSEQKLAELEELLRQKKTRSTDTPDTTDDSNPGE